MATDIKKRRVDLYPKSWEQRNRWQEEAKKRGIPLTEFLVHLIEEGLEDSSLDNKAKVIELQNVLANSGTDIKELSREIQRLKKLINVQEEELEEYRNKAFVEKSFSGVRTFNQDLINTLKGALNPISDEELLRRLNISLTNPDSVKAISAQLEALQGYNLVKLTKEGWRWVR